MMIATALFFALSGLGAKPEPPPIDAVLLRDGGIVLGQVVEPAPRGMLMMLVRRAWAEAHLPKLAARWAATEAPALKKARAQRLARLETWKRERAADPGGKDKDAVADWLAAEIDRLNVKPDASPSRLLSVAIDRREVKTVTRRPEASTRLLRLGWKAGLDGVEEMTAAELRDAIEGRGLLAKGTEPVALDDLLPISMEDDARWQVRRAATEVANEPALRFIRHQNLVLPEGQEGAPPDLGNALNALKGLLGDAPEDDPLAPKLAAAAGRGRVGVVLTRLEIAADFATVRVESALLVKTATDGWKIATVKPATVRPDDLRPDAGEELAADPQVQAAFKVAEALGIGQIDPELKGRSLKVGAATRRALHEAQAALNAEIQAWAIPVGER